MSKHPGQLTAADLTNLANYTAFARVLIDDAPSRPFSLRTLPPPEAQDDPERPQIVWEVSGRHYGRPVPAEERRVAATLA